MLTDCSNVIPFEAGFMAAPSPVAVAVAALAGPCRGSAVVERLDGTRRIIAGTQGKLYELAGSSWTDRSKAGSYTGSTESRWSFCQFGDTTIASNLADPMQLSTTGVFSDVPTAPRAKIVISASNNFVLAFHTSDPTFGVAPDRWWNCAQSNQNDWVPSVATGATTGRLVASEGAIQAGLALGDYVVAYKSRGVFLGSFVGASNGSWQWTHILGSECGAVGPEAVCDVGGLHFIVGEDNFWMFDGTRPVPLADGVNRDWFRRNSSQTFRYRTRCTFDRQRNIVWIAYPSVTSTGACDRTLAYHLGTKKWGKADRVLQAALNFIAPGVTIDGLDAYAPTIDTLPAIPFDSQYWLAGGRLYAYFDASNQLVSNTGVAGASSFTTGDFGDDDMVTMIDRFRTRFTKSPATAMATGLIKMNEGDDLVPGSTSRLNDGKFDLRQSARFHRVRVDMTGDAQMTAYDAKAIPVGQR
ncbi:hypothetical protein DBV14_09510 [Variovorax sp. KBW07]|nr:hypothetical protein DBV14_09510 [Variovorax sp. KBW07]